MGLPPADQQGEHNIPPDDENEEHGGVLPPIPYAPSPVYPPQRPPAWPPQGPPANQPPQPPLPRTPSPRGPSPAKSSGGHSYKQPSKGSSNDDDLSYMAGSLPPLPSRRSTPPVTPAREVPYHNYNYDYVDPVTECNMETPRRVLRPFPSPQAPT